MAEPLIQRDREDELASAALRVQDIIDKCKAANFSFAHEIQSDAAHAMLHLYTAGVRGVSTPKARRKDKQ